MKLVRIDIIYGKETFLCFSVLELILNLTITFSLKINTKDH